MARLFWQSDEAWAVVEQHLPRGKPGRPRVEDRRVISGILHVLKTGCRWRDVPAEYGPPTTVYNRYNRWSQRGLWVRPFERAAASGEVPTELMIDSTHVKRTARRRAGKGGEWTQGVGRLTGGRTSKVHLLADDRGRSVALALTPGNIADITMAPRLLGAVEPSRRVNGDKAYDADSLRCWLATRGTEVVIPSNAARRTPYPLDQAAYACRNLVERLVGRLKNRRRIATRYDRLACNYLAALAPVASVAEWAE